MKPRWPVSRSSTARSVSSAVVSTCSEWRASSLASRRLPIVHTKPADASATSTIRPAPAAPTSVLNRRRAQRGVSGSLAVTRGSSRAAAAPVRTMPGMAEPGPFLQTVSGRRVNPFDPEPSQLDADDIARALANVCRFGGHSRVFYSVAQHSVIVSELARAARRRRRRRVRRADARRGRGLPGRHAAPDQAPQRARRRVQGGRGAPRAGAPRALPDQGGRARDQARRPRAARYRAPRVQRRELALAGARRRRAARPRARSPGRPRRPPSRSRAATPSSTRGAAERCPTSTSTSRSPWPPTTARALPAGWRGSTPR